MGKVAVKKLQGLRAPLDAVLDVDNHFREFPRHRIRRVLIVERYVALLDHLRQQGFERVVFVAHSQGTVIAAELLRYVQQWHLLGAASAQKVDPSQTPDPSLAPDASPGAAASPVSMQALRHWLDAVPPRLMTLGSPLRQLYALRFPALYACLGNDAHTHDFDVDKADVRAELLALVTQAS